MKKLLLALMVVLTICTPAAAQNTTTVVRDSVEKVETANVDSAKVDANSSNVSIPHDKTAITIKSDDSSFPLHNIGGENALIAITAIVVVFGFPVFILFVIFFFRYKNLKARYRLAEQAIAAGQPLPEDFIRENKTVDSRSQGIKNTFTGIGLFIFLWAVTGKFEIGSIGLLITFIGIGQWIIDSKQQIQSVNAPRRHTTNKDEKRNRDNIKTEDFEIIPSESEETDKGLNEEKSDENK